MYTQDCIEIVTHCYGKIYTEMLEWQLRSLRAFPTNAYVSVCCSPKDIDTIAVISKYNAHAVYLEDSYLLRRAHGRNLCAKKTEAQCVWFCDADYVFGEGCLTSVLAQVDATSGLCFPSFEYISRDKEIVHNWPIKEEEFIMKRLRFAIGGAQIVGRDLCHKVGYLDRTDWVKPVDPKKGWYRTKCDYVLRRSLGVKSVPIDIPNCFRLRHQYVADRKSLSQ